MRSFDQYQAGSSLYQDRMANYVSGRVPLDCFSMGCFLKISGSCSAIRFRLKR